MTRETKEQTLLDLLPHIRHEAARFARRFGFEAADIEQEACIAAWKSLDTFDPSLGYQVWTYVSSTIRWALLGYWGKSRQKRRFPSKRPEHLAAEPSDHRTNPLDLQREFAEAIQPCNCVEKEVLALWLRDGYTTAEIGERMHVSHQRVSQRAKCGLEKIRRRIA